VLSSPENRELVECWVQPKIKITGTKLFPFCVELVLNSPDNRELVESLVQPKIKLTKLFSFFVELVLSSPENRELVESWVQAVFPLILDVETKAADFIELFCFCNRVLLA
jgi:hypothetical protein